MSSFRDHKPRCRTGIGIAAGLVLAACCLGGAPTRAQAPTSGPAAPTPESPPAGASSEPTPAHVEAARELILATGISRSFQIIIPDLMDQIDVSLAQSRPALANDLATVLNGLRPEFDKQADEMIDLSARIYAHLLSEQDIRSILAFFKSDAGTKYVAAQPLFLNELVAGIQAWQQKISVNMMTRVRQEMRKKGHEF